MLETVATVVACLAVIAGFTLAGMSLLKDGAGPRGATGTLGSVLGMIDPATGAPTKEEAAAAREELKQRRHEAPESGRDFERSGAYGGRIVIQGHGPAVRASHRAAGTTPNPAEPTASGVPADPAADDMK